MSSLFQPKLYWAWVVMGSSNYQIGLREDQMKYIVKVLFALFLVATALSAQVTTIRIQFTSCLRAPCVLDATNAVKAAGIGLQGRVTVRHVEDGLGQFDRDPNSHLDLRKLAREIAARNSGIAVAIIEVPKAVAPGTITESGQIFSVNGLCSSPVDSRWGKPATGKTWLVWRPEPQGIKGAGPVEVCVVR